MTPSAWKEVLEYGLPLHLRQPAGLDTDVVLDSHDMAEIVLVAQKGPGQANDTDLLYHLGMEEGRWDAVFWIVKRLVETFGTQSTQVALPTYMDSASAQQLSLDEITRSSVRLQHSDGWAGLIGRSGKMGQSLDEITDDLKPENLSRHELLQHRVVGQVWRSLGHMVIACSGGEVKPGILEVIAYLHHMEIMPRSIYSQRPSADATAIQQPPTLHLFSSKMLTALSDATFRARAKLVSDQTTMSGNLYTILGHEVPGMAYKVQAAGIRPELWLELILWSCLHGGWISEGTEILRMLATAGSAKAQNQWKALSWRSLVPHQTADASDWDKLEYMFSTRAQPTMDPPELGSLVSVRKTISSEIVDAYIDALLSKLRVGVGDRGLSSALVVAHLHLLKNFLTRSGLNLSSGSWDATILRFCETQYNLGYNISTFLELVNLSPAIAEEVKSNTNEDLPAYVFDGSAAIIGFFHRALKSRIIAGDVRGALLLFKELQSRTDTDKRTSLVDFLHKRQLFENDSENGMFASNFSGIDYPAFDTQIPSTIMGPFLELIIDARAYNFGKWLLYSAEVDGPVISERLYGDGAITPALVRFATDTNDQVLLSKLITARSVHAEAGETSLPANVLQSFFESQVSLKRWDAAHRLLVHLKHKLHTSWGIISLAHVARTMLRLRRSMTDQGQSKASDLAKSKKLFLDMVRGHYEVDFPRSRAEQINTLQTILCTINPNLAELCSSAKDLNRHTLFALPTKAFNLILEGVVEAFGSAAGRRTIEVFWPQRVRRAQKITGLGLGADEADGSRMSTYRQGVPDSVDRQRTVIRLAGSDKKIVLYGGFQPDLVTFRIVIRQAFKSTTPGEGESDDVTHNAAAASALPSYSQESETLSRDRTDDTPLDVSPIGTVIWAMRCMRSLSMADADILSELKSTLSEHNVPDIVAQLPDILEKRIATKLAAGRSAGEHT